MDSWSMMVEPGLRLEWTRAARKPWAVRDATGEIVYRGEDVGDAMQELVAAGAATVRPDPIDNTG